jgi:hypothetical protein
VPSQDLRLSWNNCHGTGLRSFSKGLMSNKNVRRLDLSWNLLGRENKDALDIRDDDSTEATHAFAQAIRRNK